MAGADDYKAPRIYEPDEPGRWRTTIIGLVVLGLALAAGLAAQATLVEREPGGRGTPSLADLDGRGEQTALDDGWFRLEPVAAAVQLEVPLRLLRTAEQLELPDRSEVTATWYVQTGPEAELVLVIVAPLDGALGEGVTPQTPLVSISLIGPAAFDTPATVPDSPLDVIATRGLTAEGTPVGLAQVTTDGHLVVIAVTHADAAVVDERFARMVATLAGR